MDRLGNDVAGGYSSHFSHYIATEDLKQIVGFYV